MPREIAHICRNCVLFNPKENVCAVTVMYRGDALELKTNPQDSCHWERVGKELGIDVLSQIKEVRVWKENGQDLIEFPNDLTEPL